MVFVNICGLCSVSDLGHMVEIGTLLFVSLVCIGVPIYMRKTKMQKRFQSAFSSYSLIII
jgi:hypothetical protein